jgi:hypothetical protein
MTPRILTTKTTEHNVQLQLMEYLAYKPVYVWRNNSGALRDKRGIPVRFGKIGSADILGIDKRSGKFIAIEVKRPDGSYKPTPAQLEFLQEIKDAGGLCGIATCTEDVDRILAGEYLIPV